MTEKYTAVSLVTVSRMLGTLVLQRCLFKARVRMRTTKNATRSVDSKLNPFST